ncbi:hypothetical protein K9L67_04340 [Candidatus Woesearchaeota archaeon]|nr:hypothetical protein [Candidatus Woesearchaeota archaeon]MCF8013026.1 hypothetical protein [Candidatus Woesearchaeota archaeon]
MRRLLLILAIIALVVFTACDVQEEVTNAPVLNLQESGNEPVQKAEVKEFFMTIEGDVVEPDTIYVNQGDHVILDINYVRDNDKVGDVEMVDDFAFTVSGVDIVDISYESGSIYYEFIAKEKGVHNFVCTNNCIKGATELDALIIVE